jgi:uncharacterized protein YprB with RNaseH-like and TPR domain
MSVLARRLGRLSAPAPVPPAPRPPGRAVFATSSRYAPGHCHGAAPLARALAAEPAALAALAFDPRLAAVDFSGMLLLDTETTGLSGGAGTLPFLIGLGGFEPDGALALEQLFLRRPGEERPLLERLAERMASASCIVSYNGKAFDWPLLRGRFVLNRLPVPIPPVHLDLLHCARRVFRHRGGSARLSQLESDVLGHEREDDVPGALIPELYFAFLRGSRWEAMHGVLEHNAQDLVGLAALMGELAHRFAAPRVGQDPRDWLGCAEVALRVRDFARAEAFALCAARSNALARDPDLRARAWTHVARARWKLGARQEVRDALLEALASARGLERAALRLALAKVSEHRLRDFGAALEHASEAAPAESRDCHDRRVARLQRKLG